MLALYGKADIAERQANHVLSAGTPLSYRRTSGLSAYACVKASLTCSLVTPDFRRQVMVSRIPRGKLPSAGKNHLRAQMGDDFRMMAVIKHAIRLKAHFAEAVGDSGLAPRTAHAAGGVDHRPLAQIQQTGVDQRLQGELRRRRVAARNGNQVRFFSLSALHSASRTPLFQADPDADE